FACWLQTFEISPPNVLGVLSALHSVYPYVVPMQCSNTNMVVLASDKPILLNLAAAQHLMNASPDLRKPLLKADIENPLDVAARIADGASDVDRLTRGVKPNSDDCNTLE